MFDQLLYLETQWPSQTDFKINHQSVWSNFQFFKKSELIILGVA